MTHIRCGKCDGFIVTMTDELAAAADPETIVILLDHHVAKHQERGCQPHDGQSAQSVSASPSSSGVLSPVPE